MTEPKPESRPNTLGWVALIGAVLGGITSVVSLLVAFAVVVRLFTTVEVQLSNVRAETANVSTLARQTADEFNGPARSKHMELVGRVASLEAIANKSATAESVQSLTVEMRQGFAHLVTLIGTVKTAEEKEK